MKMGDLLINLINKLKLNDYNVEDFTNEEIKKVETFIQGTDINKVEGDKNINYQCAVYDSKDDMRIFDEVVISVNGKEYIKKPDDSGLYHLAINLPVGTYNITATFKGNTIYNSSSITNTIIINENSTNSTDTPISNGTKKPIILGCDANTENDSTVQNRIAERLEQEGYPVEKLSIEPNAFASYDYSSKAKNKIGIYLIASGIFSIGDAAYGSGQFSNYIFGIRGDFGDRGAVNFNLPISRDADCNWVCDKLDGKTFNEMNAMLQPYVAIVGGANTDELANNIIEWLRALEHREERPAEQEISTYMRLLNYFEDAFGICEYIDEALERVQSRGYAFYFSDIYNVYETVDRIKNGDGANCVDAAELFYRLALGMNEKYGRNYKPEYLDVWCPVSGYDHVRLRLNNEEVTFYRDPACVLDGGEIDENWCGTSDNIIEVNPSWLIED